jgi:hypothetical protein
MKPGLKLAFSVLAALACVAALVLLAIRSQRVLETGLPPLVSCVDEAEALIRATKAVKGGRVFRVLGTGSMAPYIPASRAGVDPLKTTVAFAVTSGATFAEVTAGAVCLYRHAASAVGVTMHSAAARTSGGWIMSGLHNRRHDVVMTGESFVGVVAQVFTWPQ